MDPLAVIAESERIHVSQALHGYRDGHQLLATSEKLDSAAKMKLLQMSDSPGSGFNDSNTPCLTGYPLKEAGKYALAKTWPALQMGRPGCVWTHTILIDFSDLPRISDFSSLLSYFREPESLTFDEYKKSLTLSSKDTKRAEFGADDLGLEELIYRLYSTNTTVELAKELVSDETVLKVWSQQWPRLRRSFSFRTWNNKTSSKTRATFDILLSIDDLTLRDLTSPKNQDYDWLLDATLDARSKAGGDLRKFLWKHGGNTTQTREAYVPLLRAWQLLRGDKDELNELSSLLLKWHSRPSSIVRAIANKISHSDRPSLEKNTTNLLISDIGSIKINDLSRSGEELIGRSLGANQNDLLQKVIAPWTEHSDGILKGAAETMSYNAIINCLNCEPQLTDRFLAARKDILEEPSFWNYKKLANQAIEVVGRESSNTVVTAIIESDNFDFADILMDKFGDDFYRCIFNKLEEKSINKKWIEIAVRDPHSLLYAAYHHSHISIDSLDLISGYISPYLEVSDKDSDPWISAIGNAKNNDLPRDLSMFLLKRALFGSSPQIYDLLKLSITPCYGLINNYELSWNEWIEIERALQYPSTWIPLSRKDKFISGIANHIISKRYSSGELFNLTTDKILLEKIIYNISKSEEGLQYLSEVKNEEI
ncbi:GAP1-N1 domain-containing protein [Microbulbifer sp. PSTR4-B]|uniref:GAP1-N1 domain-containing protein n=1 Tax=Microbulbifer sp. PSTR4-B TaxID=3243396 RepID=UPI004039477E